ncbi:MAG: hypothetical protein IJJ33_07670 [Victivallales bacterium]|nr:hypothetical protein [Victivallales bacterium]
MDITVKTCSPLLSCDDVDNKNKNEQVGIKLRKARRIGARYIVPASSMRGVLRSLTGIISGSALDYIDENLWLCQGRDLPLGGLGKKLYLAEVIKPGTAFEDGSVRFGEAMLVRDSALNFIREEYIDNNGNTRQELWIDNPNSDSPSKSNRYDAGHPYRVKVSGRKVNTRGGEPHEGAFKQKEAREIVLDRKLWLDYQGRNRNGVRSTLYPGDLVWLEPDNDEGIIEHGGQVKSIQWARWGRKGVNFLQKLKEHGLQDLLPDYYKNDGLVDITSDLFGSIPNPPKNSGKNEYSSFAARVRPDNLVFEEGTKTIQCNMASMSSPHPGCIAFYMDNDDYDTISLEDLPKGYKVYRTTKERGEDAPWNYDVQPIFENGGRAKPFEAVQKMTRKAELVAEGSVGHFKLSYRSLTKEEFALLLLVLSCDLRIGGGKPFGLGHCVVTGIAVHDEVGNKILEVVNPKKASVPEAFMEVAGPYLKRAELYCKTQEPVEKLRYPRAVNDKGNQKSGMVWFVQNASPKKNARHGLQTQWVCGNPENQKLQGKEQIRAQGLKRFEPLDPASDMLFGYDVGFRFVYGETGNQRYMTNFQKGGFRNESFQRRENTSPNRNSRQNNRDRRQ